MRIGQRIGGLTPPQSTRLVMGAVAALALTLTACSSNGSGSSGNSAAAAPTTGSGNSSAPSAATPDLHGKKVLFIAGDQGDAFYITLDCGLKSEAAKYGIDVSMEAPKQFEAIQQTPLVNAAVASHPAALLIAPTDKVAMYPPLQQAAAAGLKVGFVDTTLKDPSMAFTQVSTDDTKGGQVAASAMAKLVPQGSQVAILNVTPGLSTTDDRAAGFTQQAKSLGLQVVSQQYAGNSTAKAESLTAGLLAKYPHLAGLFTTTSFGAQGASTALRQEGQLDKVKIVGFDADPLMVKLLKEGSVQAISAQQARQIGIQAMQQTVAELTGKPVTKKILLPTTTITTDNLNAPASKAALQQFTC